MKVPMSLVLAAAMATLVAGCATAGGGSRAEARAESHDLYRTHAGEPVPSIRYLGSPNSFTPLDDSSLVIWTKPNEAFLLDLFGPCQELEWTPVIGLTSRTGRVYAKFDKVLAQRRGSPMSELPCPIQTIRPIDVPALRDAQRALTAERKAAAG